MAFIRFGTPAKLKISHVCDLCRQPKPLVRVTTKDGQKSVCPDCAKKVNNGPAA